VIVTPTLRAIGSTMDDLGELLGDGEPAVVETVEATEEVKEVEATEKTEAEPEKVEKRREAG